MDRDGIARKQGGARHDQTEYPTARLSLFRLFFLFRPRLRVRRAAAATLHGTEELSSPLLPAPPPTHPRAHLLRPLAPYLTRLNTRASSHGGREKRVDVPPERDGREGTGRMALLPCQSLPGIGCGSIALVARARVVQQCLAAASHAPLLPPLLLRANGGGTAGNAIGSSGRRIRRRKDLRVVVAEASAAAAAAKVTPASPGGVSISDVLWPSAGESQTPLSSCHGWLPASASFVFLFWKFSEVSYFIWESRPSGMRSALTLIGQAMPASWLCWLALSEALLSSRAAR